MAKINGSNIRFLIGAVELTGLKDVSFDYKGAMIDVTNKNSNGAKEVIPGLKEFTMSGSGFVDWTTPKGVKDVINAMINRSVQALVKYTSGSPGDYEIDGSGYFTQVSLKAGTEDAFSFTWNFQGTADITLNAL
jgi:hypothetical protein